MDINNQKEQFGIAYVRAIASVAGYSCYKPEVDDNSIDIGFKSSTEPYQIVEAQLKTTENLSYIKDGNIHFPLPIKNYNELRGKSIASRILICVVVPNGEPSSWINQNEEQLALMKCAYWVSLKDFTSMKNTKTVTVQIPMSQIFSIEALKSLMAQKNETVKEVI